MIEVVNLSKNYGQTQAVQNISFTVEDGEILGFLGPNGAGKTTTLRLITTFLKPTSGTVFIDGKDIRTEAREVRKKIGYLPENAPSYPDMKVSEFLHFRMKLKGMNRKERKERLEELVDQFRLHSVRNRLIGELSKGYRQRVGMAEAISHNPPLLILDEPTAGMDPSQKREVRSLIRELAGKHTIIFSTHILPEVEQLCEKVVIIHQGQIVSQGRLEDLKTSASQTSPVLFEVRGDLEDLEDEFKNLPLENKEILEERDEFHLFRLHPRVKEGEESSDLRDLLFEKTLEKGWKLRTLARETESLEEIFIQLTQ